MKYFALSCVLLATCIYRCDAQWQVYWQPIPYVRHLPTFVSKRLSHGAKSCFYGSFKLGIKDKEPNFLVHLYQRNTKKEVDLIYRDSPHHYKVDIFESDKAGRYRLLNSFPVDYEGWPESSKVFGATLMWLDPKEHQKPIIMFACSSFIKHRERGDHVFAIFTDGLKSKPTIQNFPFGSWEGRHVTGQDNKWYSADKNSLLQIHTQVFWSTQFPLIPPVIWRWDGEKFRPVRENEAE